MADILVLVPTRWKLRRVVAMVHQILTSLGLQMHPDKTFMGRIEKGFSFLGYQFSPAGLSVALPTLDKFVARALWLYERERGRLPACGVRGTMDAVGTGGNRTPGSHQWDESSQGCMRDERVLDVHM